MAKRTFGMCVGRKLDPLPRQSSGSRVFPVIVTRKSALAVKADRYTASAAVSMSKTILRPESTGSAGVSAANRRRLEALHRAGQPVTASSAASLLEIDQRRARRLLAYFARRGWLARLRRGMYVAVPLDANVSGDWSEDPWVVATAAFAPCYVGGWSALEHWGLTEQVFRTVFVFTTRRVRHRDQGVRGASIRLKVIRPDRLFGTQVAWRRQTSVQVSDPSRTLVDVLDDPSVGGGTHHVAAALAEYFGSDELRADPVLIEYAIRFGNGAVFKRLGYLVEALSIEAPELLATCRSRITAGLSVLDPTVTARGHIVRRWRLRVNVDISDVETWA